MQTLCDVYIFKIAQLSTEKFAVSGLLTRKSVPFKDFSWILPGERNTIVFLMWNRNILILIGGHQRNCADYMAHNIHFCLMAKKYVVIECCQCQPIFNILR